MAGQRVARRPGNGTHEAKKREERNVLERKVSEGEKAGLRPGPHGEGPV